jgi:excisionase family DNA binding protein
MNVTETAHMLRLKESTIRSWILNKRIPYVKLGRRVFVRLADALNVIESSVVYPDAQLSQIGMVH